MSEHVLEHLSAYLDGALGGAEKERFRAHLAECAACAKRLEQLAFVDAALRDLPSGAPDGYFEELPSRVRGRLSASRRSQRSLARFPLWTLAAAAALMVAVLAPLTLQQRSTPAASVSARLADQAPVAPAAAEADKLARVGRPAAAPPATLAPAPSVAAGAVPAEEFRVRSETKKRALRAKAEASRSDEAPVAFAAPAAPAPPPGKTAPAGGFAEPPRPAAQAAQQSGPRVSQQAVARRQTPMKEGVDAPAAVGEAAARDTARERETKDPKDAQAPAERAFAKSDKKNETGRVAGLAAASRPLPSARYRELQARAPQSAAEARSLREAWRVFSAEAADAGEADEARVRVIEMGLNAWRLERRPEDRSLAEREAAAYLERADARQAARVRSLLAALGR